jgi:uncharacterized protein
LSGSLPPARNQIACCRLERVPRLHRLELDRQFARHRVEHPVGNVRDRLQPVVVQVPCAAQLVRRRHFRHRLLVFEAGLLALERDDHRQDRLAILDRLHTPRREGAAVAHAVDFIDDRQAHVAGAQKVRVQRMRDTGGNRAAGGHQGLADDLAAEHAFAAQVARLSAEQVDLKVLEVEQIDQILQNAIHDSRLQKSGAKPTGLPIVWRHSAPDGATQRMNCRSGCGACCIAPSISSPIPGMPEGKPAGVRCVQLDDALRCRLFGDPRRPAVCGGLAPEPAMCGTTREYALRHLAELERLTGPQS